MKLKKLLAGVTAAALAVGLVAVTPMFASAEGKTEEYDIELKGAIKTWDDKDILCEHQSTHLGEATWDQYEKAEFIVTLDNMNSSVTAIKVAGIAGWDWIIDDSLTVDELASDGTYTKTLDFTTLSSDEIASLSSVLFRVETNSAELVTDWGITAKLVLTQKDGAVVIPKDTWVTNSDGKLEFTRGTATKVPTLDIDPLDFTDSAKSDITNIHVVFATPLGSAKGIIGVANAKGDWVTADWGDTAGNDISWDIAGLSDDQLIQIQIHWANAGDKIIIDSIEITGKSDVSVTGITVAPATAELKVNETATLKATVTPTDATNKTVTWTSSNTKVATVEGGVVTAVGAGTATITATAGTESATAAVTVTAAAPVVEEVIPSINKTEVTVNGETLADQQKELAGAFKVTIEGLTEGTDFTTATTFTEMAGESDSTATVKVTLKNAGYKIPDGKDTFNVKVKFVKLDDSEYQGYTADTTVDIKAAEDDTDETVKAAVQAAIEAKSISLKGIDTADKSGNIGLTMSDMTGLDSVKAKTGSYTVTVDINVYDIIRQDKDHYYAEGITLGDSSKASSKITLTFTVNVTAPEKSDEPTPDKPTPDEPTPDKPAPDEPTPDKPTPDEPTPDKPTPDEPTPGTPSTPSTPGTPDAPAAVVSASSPRIGEGTVSTDINTGAAFTGTRAMEEVSRAKPGDSINIVMTGGMNEGEIIAKIAYKKNVTVNLKYSAYTVSINSDDVSEDFEAKGFYSTARFLSAKEKAAFAGAKELRQINVKNLDGIEKATITVTMRGGSKGMDATALNRLSAGKYKTVGTGKVAEDRTFSFEITKAGNYVVYTGKIDMGE